MRKALLIPFVASALLGCAPGTGDTTGTGGGSSTGSGGASTGSGGASTGSGGASTGSGGAPTGSGGMMSSGGMMGSGGSPTGSGGAGTGTGGAGTGTGGRMNTGGANTGGMANTGGAAGGSSGNLMDVAKPINGVLVTGPCDHDVSNGGSVCDTRKVGAACPDQNVSDIPLLGIKTFDKMYTLGGTAGTKYRIALHVQGEVEAKTYTGGTNQEGTKTSPNTDGWYYPAAGATARVVQGTYNVYMLRVKTPGGVQSDYFLNAIQPPGVQNHTTYGMDYMANLDVEGTSTIRIVSSDSNCQMIRNCGPTENDGSRCAAPITPANVEMDLKTANPTFDFTKPFDGQWLGITVKSVTQM